MKRKKSTPFLSAKEEVMELPKNAGSLKELIKRPSSSELAFLDQNFLLKDEARPVRLQLEALKPEVVLQENQITSTIVVFGSARIASPEAAKANLAQAEKAHRENPSHETQALLRICERDLAQSHYYKEAQEFARIVSSYGQNNAQCNYVITTGGGPGIMEAANRGASEVNAKTIGFNIFIPYEQMPNPYITPELNFQFHYFSMRKMHFLLRARALVAFPGGFGTLDELFEVLTLLQTHKILPIPVLLFGKRFWKKLINFDYLVEEGFIDPDDLKLFHFVESAQEAWQYIASFFTDNPTEPKVWQEAY